MKIELKLLRAKKETAEGYPLVFEASHQGRRKQKKVGFAKDNHFSETAKMISVKHPDYDVLAPRLMELQLRARKICLGGETDVAAALEQMFAVPTDSITIAAFGAEWLAEQKELAAIHDRRGELVERNRVSGYAESVENALKQFNAVVPNATVERLDYATLMKFVSFHKRQGNSGNTIHLYLRSIRQLYNKACLKYKIPNTKPFEGVFAGLKTRSSQNRKKYLKKDTVRLLEGLKLNAMERRSVDMFLLQFYFGGCDLTDIYHLKKSQIRKGRVRFERGKVSGGHLVDLKIHPKAQAILDKYPSSDDYVFPWGKTRQQYKNWRSKTQKLLKEVQAAQATLAADKKDEALKIEVQPDGGHLAPKVARHTFANIAKGLFIEEDIIRELMGHERDDVDNYYKDKYTEKVRDAALFKIIG